MADTTDGFPYPPASDALGNGAAWIQDLAEYVDGLWTPWTSYTPAITGLTLGTGGTKVAEYRRLMDAVDFRVTVTLGTGGDFSTTLELEYGVPGLTTLDVATDIVLGPCYARDYGGGGTGIYTGVLLNSGGGFTYFSFHGTAGVANSTIPFNWADGDVLSAAGRYKIAGP